MNRSDATSKDLLKQQWVARNVPNDDLDLMVPIWDKDLAWLSKVNAHALATCTAYCEVREYDTRGQRRPVIDAKIFDNKVGKNLRGQAQLPLTKIFPSQLSEHNVFVITQEGHPIMLDRRMNY